PTVRHNAEFFDGNFWAPADGQFIVVNHKEGLQLCDGSGAVRALGHKQLLQHRLQALSPDGRLVATEGVKVWDLTSGRGVLKLPGRGPVVFSSDGRFLAVQTDYRAVTVWDLAPTPPYLRTLDWPDAVLQVASSPRAHAVAVVGGKTGGFPASFHGRARLLD